MPYQWQEKYKNTRELVILKKTSLMFAESALEMGKHKGFLSSNKVFTVHVSDLSPLLTTQSTLGLWILSPS